MLWKIKRFREADRSDTVNVYHCLSEIKSVQTTPVSQVLQMVNHNFHIWYIAWHQMILRYYNLWHVIPSPNKI